MAFRQAASARSGSKETIMKKTAFVCVTASVLFAGYACSSKQPVDTGGPGGSQSGSVGSLRFNLEITPGVNIDTVGYQVTASDIPAPITGSIPLGSYPGTRFTAV